ncbi:YjbH domain-containing protein [Mangrovicoccus sp. HB161399]|uniref:YjbH domain-containing protein n=1 Tax=Mangrovicoccus sp. HB161399 TaxID=2720392 RepID=UPI00155346B4|nr:YjbH domain-containing protein [Mangrovicoccus sp. HB161399]
MGRRQLRASAWLAGGTACLGFAVSGKAQDLVAPRTEMSFMGRPGIVEMPVATSQPDAQMSLGYMQFDNVSRTSLSFQASNRLSGTFRYSILEGFDEARYFDGNRYDRSFDIGFRFIDEGQYRPAFAVGLQDFTGTGVYSAEYVAASKTVADGVRLTGGIGWGRLGSHDSFDNPLGFLNSSFKTRPGLGGNEAGKVQFDQWFRGPAALFGGVEWQATDQLQLNVEYSSDAYVQESDADIFDYAGPLNVSAEYQFGNGIGLSAAVLGGGTTFSGMLSYSFNVKTPPGPLDREAAPLPVAPRSAAPELGSGWSPSAAGPAPAPAALQERAAALLDEQGLRLTSLTLARSSATLYIVNDRYPAVAEAIGRAARAMTHVLPPGIGRITIVTQAQGMPVTSVTLERSELEHYETDLDGAWNIYSTAQIEDAEAPGVAPPVPVPGSYPYFEYGLGLYAIPLFFDVDEPVRGEVGLQLGAGVETSPGLIFSGNLRQKIAGNIDDSERPPNSDLPHVRTDTLLYYQATDLEMTHLTAEYFFRPGENVYGRFTAGYLERMYGGASGEVLWKPVDSPLGLGLELDYAVKRDFDMGFGFQDYDVALGFASVYYDFQNGYVGQVDAGRYLAGDWGATFSLDREFDNGWRVGAFFTLTDVPFDEFGEGSFDKGIVVEIPITWLSGQPSKDGFGTTLRPVTRDGGAQLDVRNRLYDLVRRDQEPDLGDGWGRFWR